MCNQVSMFFVSCLVDACHYAVANRKAMLFQLTVNPHHEFRLFLFDFFAVSFFDSFNIWYLCHLCVCVLLTKTKMEINISMVYFAKQGAVDFILFAND